MRPNCSATSKRWWKHGGGQLDGGRSQRDRAGVRPADRKPRQRQDDVVVSLPESVDTGVIVNEAGEINVDGAVVSSGRRDLPMTLLGNGCVCCSLGDDLHAAIDELLAVRRRSGAGGFRRIILETSGLAMPGPILRSLMRYDRAEYRLRIVSTLDPLDPMTDDAMFPVRSAQLTAARSIVITKLDRAGGNEIRAAEFAAKQFNPTATRIAMLDRQARARAVFAPGPWVDLRDWLEDLAGFCGDRLLRVKGLVSVVGVPQSVLIDGVGTTFAEPRRMELGPSGRRGLVIIGRDVDLTEMMAFSAGYSAHARPVVTKSSKRAA